MFNACANSVYQAFFLLLECLANGKSIQVVTRLQLFLIGFQHHIQNRPLPPSDISSHGKSRINSTFAMLGSGSSGFSGFSGRERLPIFPYENKSSTCPVIMLRNCVCACVITSHIAILVGGTKLDCTLIRSRLCICTRTYT